MDTNFSTDRRDQYARNAGFTVIELVVVVAIMVLITGLMLANNNRYGGQVLLQNFAYDVALSIRQAQVYGISVQRFGTGVGSSFSAGYGIHFDISTPITSTTYTLFGDALSRNGLYDCPTPGTNCELVSATNINRNYKISKLCYTLTGGTETCNPDSSGNPADMPKTIDILFVRPEPDALITACGASCSSSCLTGGTCAASARIFLQSPRGDTMSVSVQANGQIAVDQKSVMAP